MKGGGDRKKIHGRENAKKKNSCKEEGKEKKFMQKEGPIVTFSESLSFFQKVWVSEINNITRHNMNKQFLAFRKHNRTRIKDKPTLLVPFAANGKLVFSILAISI